MTLFDITGRPIRTLHSGRLGQGRHTFSLDGSDLPAGLYLIEAVGEGFRETRQAVIVK